MKNGKEQELNNLSENEREFALYVTTPLLSVDDVIPEAQTCGVPYDHIEMIQWNNAAIGNILIMTK